MEELECLTPNIETQSHQRICKLLPLGLFKNIGCITLPFRKLAPIILVMGCAIFLLLYYSSPTDMHYATQTASAFKHPFTASDMMRKRLKYRGAQRRLPQALIIGVRKCGTRALIEMLNMHPYVSKNGAEMHFFDDDEKYTNGLEWYRKKMPYSFPDQVTVEKTPSYFVSREAPARIKSMNSSIKILLIIREPATRVLSDYTQVFENKRQKGFKVPSFRDKILTKDGEINERWLRHFSRDQILVVDGDKMIVDPFSEIDRVQKFLSLPPRLYPDNFYYNETKGFYCMRNETHQKCLADSKGRPHPIVDAVLMSRLRKYFTPFNDRFYEAIGHNFSWPRE